MITVTRTSEGRTYSLGENTVEAKRQAEIATFQVALAAAQVALANAERLLAETAAATATGALAQTNLAGTFPTKADATAGLGGIAADAYVQVLADETQGGRRTLYRKTGGALVLAHDYGKPFVTEIVSSGAGRIAERLVNTLGSNRADTEFNTYLDSRTSNVPADPVDDIVGMGFNVGANGAQLDPSKTTLQMQFERIFAGVAGSLEGFAEWFLQLLYATGTFPSGDQKRRPIGLFAGLGLNGVPTCTVGIEATTFLFSRYSDKALTAQINVEDGEWDLLDSRVRWNNDTPMLAAFAADGVTIVDLARFGSDDTLQLTAPLSVNAAAKTADLLGRKALVTWNCTGGLAANDAVHVLNGPTFNSYYFFQDFQGESTAGIACRFNNASGPMWMEVNGTSQAGQIFTATYGTWCAVGVHNASDEFRICAENNLTSQFLMRFKRSTRQMILDPAAVPNHVDDAAAAAGGTPVGGVYRNGSALMLRVA